MAPEVYLYMGGGIFRTNAVRIEVHRSVTEIPDRLFEYCDLLESLLLHDGLLKIGKWAFRGCTSLRGFRCPATVTEIGRRAFYGCSSLADVKLPGALKSIEAETFCDCKSLEAIAIPSLVTRIDDGAFYGCTNLALVEIREGLRWIGSYTFKDCSSLESLHIPSVEDIGEEAFMSCTNLASVRLHENLERVGKFAFRGCTSLESFGFVLLSERMEVITLDEQTATMFEGRLNKIANVMVGESDNPWEECKETLQRAHNVLTLKESTATIELALWRMKIDREEGERADVIGDGHGGEDLSAVLPQVGERLELEGHFDRETWQSRQECRVKCGAHVVIGEVLKFFSYSMTRS